MNLNLTIEPDWQEEETEKELAFNELTKSEHDKWQMYSERGYQDIDQKVGRGTKK